MLKGIDPILTPALLHHLCAMGHGEWVAVVDANFTAEWLAQGKPVLRLPGLDLLRVSRAVLSVLPLALDVPAPVGYMQHSDWTVGQTTSAQQRVIDFLQKSNQLGGQQIEAVERFEFYRRVQQASVFIQSGESSAYGNFIFCKGVIGPVEGF